MASETQSNSRVRIARNVALLVGGTGAAQVIVLVTSPVLTRIYTPEHFGVLAAYASVVGIVIVIAGLRYELAIPLAPTESVARDVLSLSLGAVVINAALAAVLVWLLGRDLAGYIGVPELAPYFWLVPVGLFLGGSKEALSYWAVRRQRFGIIARTKFSESAGTVGIQLLFGLIQVTPLGLILGHSAGYLAGLASLAREAMVRGGAASAPERYSAVLSAAWTYRRFPLISSYSGLLNSGSLLLPQLILFNFHGPVIAGWFMLSRRVLGIPVAVLGQAAAQVFYGEAAHLVRTDPSKSTALLKWFALRLLLLGGIPIVGVSLLAPGIFSVVFGESWRAAGVYTQLLVPMLVLQITSAPISQILNILQRQDVVLAWDIFRALLSVGLVYIIAEVFDSPNATVLTYSAAMSVSYAVLLYLCFRISKVEATMEPLEGAGKDSGRTVKKL